MTDRPLLLHISALSPAEYQSFIAALAELSGDTAPDQAGSEYWEEKPVGVLEAKGWLRGRYGLDVVTVDKILRLFYPNLAQTDVLSASQFFGVLRLVSHAQSGKTPARELVFVQANPLQDQIELRPSPRRPALDLPKVTTDQTLIASSPPDNYKPFPSLHTPGRQRQFPSDPFPSTPIVPTPISEKEKEPVKEKPPKPSPLSANPFRRSVSAVNVLAPVSVPPPFPAALATAPAVPSRRDTSPSPPPPHPFSRSTPYRPPPPNSQTTPTPNPTGNPFVNRPPLPPPLQTPTSPPLPPRKPPLPPRSDSAVLHSNYQNQPPPRHPVQVPKPPKPSSNISPLIKQSLIAAKGAQALKASETSLEKQKVWEVIGKSSSKERDKGRERNDRDIDLRPSGSNPWTGNVLSSPPSSTSSLELVASTKLDSSDGRHSHSGASADSEKRHAPRSEPMSKNPTATPTRVPLTSSLDDLDSPILPQTPRTSRSKSMHSPTPPQPPLPPPPRRRPESVQLSPTTSSPFTFVAQPSSLGNSDRGTPTTLSRHTSLSSSSRRVSVSTTTTTSSAGSSAPEALQNLYTSVKKRAENFQPRMETVRLKAEQKLVPGGFAHRGVEGERLVDSREDDEDGDDGAGVDYGDADVDGEYGEWKEWDRTAPDSKNGTPMGVGDGWKRLGG